LGTSGASAISLPRYTSYVCFSFPLDSNKKKLSPAPPAEGIYKYYTETRDIFPIFQN
jgi:hypothetical protein